jgi:branched-chain amino acid transport system substrate-binding protein
MALAAGLAGPAVAQEDTFKIGVITFLSGQAAESFGVPAWNGGKLLIDMLNEGGKLPAPYDKKGFGGMTIEAVEVDDSASRSTRSWVTSRPRIASRCRRWPMS